MIYVFRHANGAVCSSCLFHKFKSRSDVEHWHRGDMTGEIVRVILPEAPNPWEVDNGKAFALLYRVWFWGCADFATNTNCCCLFFEEQSYFVFNGRLK